MTSNSTSDLQWLLVRKHNAFLHKTPYGISFSSEPGNLLNKHSKQYSGFTNSHTLSITPSKSKKGGIVIRTRSVPGELKSEEGVSSHHHVRKAYKHKVFKAHGSRGLNKKVSTLITSGDGYRPDLHKVALARASAIYKSQHPAAEKAPKTYKGDGKRAQKAAAGAEATTSASTSSKKQKASKASSKKATGTTAPAPAQAATVDDDDELPELV